MWGTGEGPRESCTRAWKMCLRNDFGKLLRKLPSSQTLLGGAANTPRFVLLRASMLWKAGVAQRTISGVVGLPQSAVVAPKTGRADF